MRRKFINFLIWLLGFESIYTDIISSEPGKLLLVFDREIKWVRIDKKFLDRINKEFEAGTKIVEGSIV